MHVTAIAIGDIAKPGLARDDRFDLLRKLPFFDGVGDPLLGEVAGRCRIQAFSPEQIIVDAGDTTTDVYVIISGSARITLRTAFGYEAIIADIGDGAIFGELPAFDGDVRSANVTALTQTTALVIPAAAFMDLVFSSRPVAHRLLQMLSSRLRNTSERLVESTTLSVRQRLIAELLRLSRARGQTERAISPPPAQHVIAARVGTRRESVSREMSLLCRSGLMTITRGAIILHNPEALRSEVNAHR